ncbi:4279_t:CDS:2 [Racocetra fulgida]|uniref:4279_t:CDS:1 n=1 Tax=Racocetra fulgida TaxID=60492 RepID=A0A9N8ZZ40_9GLOM|nr:4279_t:CDS:2 [Racocetra fulgida]
MLRSLKQYNFAKYDREVVIAWAGLSCKDNQISIFQDNHIIVEEDYIDAIVDYFKNDNQVDVYGDLMNKDHEIATQDNFDEEDYEIAAQDDFDEEDYEIAAQDDFDEEDHEIATQDNLVNNEKDYLATVRNVLTNIED